MLTLKEHPGTVGQELDKNPFLHLFLNLFCNIFLFSLLLEIILSISIRSSMVFLFSFSTDNVNHN